MIMMSLRGISIEYLPLNCLQPKHFSPLLMRDVGIETSYSLEQVIQFFSE